MINGISSNTCFREKPLTVVLPRKITDSLLKPSSGLPEPVLPGKICRRSLATGTAFMSVTTAGQAKGYGKRSLKRSVISQIWSIDGGRQHCPGSPTRGLQKNGRDEEAEGKSRGGLSTKIHAAVDGLGYPLRFLLTGGQAFEYGQSERLIADFLQSIYWQTRATTRMRSFI
jgi:hypothetical protein